MAARLTACSHDLENSADAPSPRGNSYTAGTTNVRTNFRNGHSPWPNSCDLRPGGYSMRLMMLNIGM